MAKRYENIENIISSLGGKIKRI